MCSRICKHNYRITIIVKIGYHDHSLAGLVVTSVPLARDDMHSPRATVKHTSCSPPNISQIPPENFSNPPKILQSPPPKKKILNPPPDNFSTPPPPPKISQPPPQKFLNPPPPKISQPPTKISQPLDNFSTPLENISIPLKKISTPKIQKNSVSANISIKRKKNREKRSHKEKNAPFFMLSGYQVHSTLFQI